MYTGEFAPHLRRDLEERLRRTHRGRPRRSRVATDPEQVRASRGRR